MTSKLQITVPKALADKLGIRPGDDVDWVPSGDSVRLVPAGRRKPLLDLEERLRPYDRATERQREREKGPGERATPRGSKRGRGWTREELYDRG